MTTTIAQPAYDPCDPANIGSLVVPGTLSNPKVVEGFEGDSDSAQTCCYDCYWNDNCVYWIFDARQWLCLTYGVDWRSGVQGKCTTGVCPYGLPSLQAGVGDGRTFGVGPCVGDIS